MSFKVAPKPALNRDGYAKVTFVNCEHGEKTNEETGEVKEYARLVFSIMDLTRKNPIKTSVFIRALGTKATDELLDNLGFNFSSVQPELKEDDDGFASHLHELADDDFEQTDEELALVEQVEAFLSDIEGKTYLAKVAPDKNGYWAIDVKSLEPFKSKQK